MKGRWVEPDLRDEVVDRIEAWHTLTAIPRTSLLSWAAIRRATYYDWSGRQGLANRHNPPRPTSPTGLCRRSGRPCSRMPGSTPARATAG